MTRKISLSYLFLFLFVTLLSGNVQAKFYLTIDSFISGPILLILSIEFDADPAAWYSPYGQGAGTPPVARYANTESALGGQRDFVIGFEGTTPSGSLATMSISQRRCSIAFPENYAGGAYAQWDGDDFLGVDPDLTPFPGSMLSQTPGLGAHVNTTPFSERNPDGVSVDFTSGGRAYGIFISITVDHDQTEYYLDAYDVNGVFNSIKFYVDISLSGPNIIFHRYDASGWTSNQNALGFDWTKVVAFQVRLWTYSDSGASQAIDSSYAFLNTFGYVITVTVELDCQCEGLQVTPVEGELVTLKIQGSSTILGTYQSDVNGVIQITEDFLDDGITYQLCLADLSTDRCSPASGCLTVVLNAFQDSPVLTFTLSATVELFVPGPATYPCDFCQFPDGTTSCPEFGLTTTCDGTVERATYTDVRNVNTCATVITRTWRNEFGQTGVQVLTFSDQDDPIFTSPPQDLVQDCRTVTVSLQEWLNQDAFATASDRCTSTVITNDWDLTLVGSCDSVEVNFVVRDACLHSSLPLSAVYEIFDDQPPQIVRAAVDNFVECVNPVFGNDNSVAFNNWLSNRGGAVASDECTSFSWTNDFTGTFVSDCFGAYTVTFTPRDDCGNTGSGTVGVFTVDDETPPTFTSLPTNTVFQCDPSSNAASLQNYINNHGGATVTDACTPTQSLFTWSNSPTVPPDFSCLQEQDILFTVVDACGNDASQLGSVTFQDTVSPFFTVNPQSSSTECGPNAEDDYDFWFSTFAGAAADDLCNSATLSANFLSSTPISCGERRTVSIVATDDCALTTSRQVTFTIQDTDAPTWIVEPQDSGSECDELAQTMYEDWLADPGAIGTDVCTTAVLTFSPVLLRLGCDTDTDVTFFLTDDCGNRVSSVATFTIVDTTDPFVVTAPQDLSLECDSANNQAEFNSWVNSSGGGVGDDICTSAVWSFSDPTYRVSPSCQDRENFIFTLSDQCGNSVDLPVEFDIVDSLAPDLLVPASDRNIECTGDPTQDFQSWVASHGGAVAVDRCSSVSWTENVPSLTGDACRLSSTVEFVASDSCSRTVRTTATFTSSDTRPPVINPGASSLNVECNPNDNENQFRNWVLDLAGAVAVDACSTVTWSGSANTSPIGCDSEFVTFIATDACGLESRTSATFTIDDSVFPTIFPQAADLTVTCDGLGNLDDYDTWVATRGGASATDVCAFSLDWSNTASGVAPLNCGSETVTFFVEDECGNVASTIATYRVVDNEAPTFVTLPSDSAAECDRLQNPIDIAQWIVTRGGASAIDNCSATETLQWSTDFTEISPTSCGAVETVTFRVTDTCAQIARQTATFRITDTQPPIITRQAGALVLECGPEYYYEDDIDEFLADRGGASATDRCSTNLVWTNDFIVRPNPCTGPLPVAFRVTDACGNFAVTTGSIEVTDSIPPVFVNFPADVSLECDEPTDSSFTGIPNSFDACDAPVDLVEVDYVEILPSERFCPGDTVITRVWSLIDTCGNINTRNQTVVVKIPVGDCLPVPCISCDDLPKLCCASSLAPVPCNPVECFSVPCADTDCSTVPCLPVVCGNGSPPPYSDDDDTIQPSPVPDPSNCAPIYIYVFDDDDTPIPSQAPVRQESSATTISLSFFLAIIVLFLF